MIIHRFAHLYYIVIASLLSLLPLVAEGQTSVSYQGSDKSVPAVKMCPSDGWKRMLWKGGQVRSARGDWYLKMPEGANGLFSMNFVDGYGIGPQATIGHFATNRSRWELYENVRWTFSREALIAKGALRWYSAVERSVMLEVYGGQYTEDFDHDPILPHTQQELAAALFAWNHSKLLERTDAGLRVAFPINNNLMFRAEAGWERRRQMENHRRTNSFGAHPQSNVPRIRSGNTARELTLYDGPVDGQLGRLGLQLEYTPQSKHYVFDDMTCRTASHLATVGFDAQLGAGSWHFASFDLHVRQSLSVGQGNDQLQYQASVGGILKHGEIGLADWHHFNASTFFWQSSNDITRFAMLDPYELSTDEIWAEAHAEWICGNMLLSRLAKQPGIVDEYVQLHAVKVPGHRAHLEAQYGVSLMRMMRLGLAVGWDNLTCRGVAFTLSLDVFKAAQLR